MSRMEKKRKLKKNTRYLNITLLMLFLVLILGILATDYALREMLALFDEEHLFAYQRQDNLHHFEVFGDQFYIDQDLIYTNLKGSLEWGRLQAGNIIEKLKQVINKMSG